MPPRIVALLGAVCLTTGWLLASIVTPPVARVQSLPERRNAPSAGDDATPAPFSEQLRWRLQQAPAAPSPRRNPFVFGERTTSPSLVPLARQTPPAAAVSDVPAGFAVVGPGVSLSGIGVTGTPDGDLRTAVLSDGMTVYLVKTGQSVVGYTVTEVTEGSVTLTDRAGTPYVLRLKN